MAADQGQDNIKQEYNNATVGLNLDQTLTQIGKGALTFALNASVENYDANSINYQNEEGNEFCLTVPEGFINIGNHFIADQNKHIFFLTNPDTGDNEIGYMNDNDCIYHTLISAPCLNFNINHPIQKVVNKITNCGTEIFWTDGLNPRRHLNIDDIPKELQAGSSLCHPIYSDNVDCNQLKIQPDFSIPMLSIFNAIDNGDLTAGTVQFAVQYSDAVGNPYTSYYSITNPTPIADPTITTVNFNYPVSKSIVVKVDNLDSTGQFQYYNLAVLKTINGVTSVDLVGTFYIDEITQYITYSGQSSTDIRLTINDIFEKFPIYEIAQDLTTAQDILIWDNLTSIDRVNYQSIASQITLGWESYRIPSTENYANELNATNLRSYLRDEVYAFELVLLLASGKQTDGFHIPGRIKNLNENYPDIPDTDPDFIGTPDYDSGGIGYSPYWKIYNTASVDGTAPEYTTDPKYKGPYQYGKFAYWESSDEYPCNELIWGDLAGQKIRHHKFPDVLVSPIYESKLFYSPDTMVMGNDAVFPIGVRVDEEQIAYLIANSSLTNEQKAEVIGYKIVRGNRGTNKSIVAKGILRNVNQYFREGQPYLYPNYPYNDLGDDPFLNSTNNAFSQICIPWKVTILTLGTDTLGGLPFANLEYTDCNTNKVQTLKIDSVGVKEYCSITRPIIKSPAKGTVGYATYEIWVADHASVPFARGYTVQYVDPIKGSVTVWINGVGGASNNELNVVPGTGGVVGISGPGNTNIYYKETHNATIDCGISDPLPSIENTPDLAYNQIFNSPETSFGQPFLGHILKLESVMFGAGKAHFVEVKNNAKYKLVTENAQKLALDSSDLIARSSSPFNFNAMFTAYQAYLTIYINGITRKNYAYSFNSIADYNYGASIPNGLGVKQRNLEVERYLIPAVQSIGLGPNINNFERESSIYLKTQELRNNLPVPALPYPDKTPNLIPGGVSIVTDESRFTISEKGNCAIPAKEEPIQVVSYYASLKNQVSNQWGQIYSYDTIDTGFQKLLSDVSSVSTIVFGGDTFIGRFAFKTKLPFFIDNRVNAPDDSDIFYDEIGNVAYPRYWHSARSILKDYAATGIGILSNIISYKAHNFDCPNDGINSITAIPITSSTTTTSTTSTTLIPGVTLPSDTLTYYDGYFYMFAYGVPNFYCESSYNLDLRQAFNNREGDFFPHVSNSIPDNWVQENFVSIAQDNTYYYNITYSKQNIENTFTHLPADWDKICLTYYPFRAIYSDAQNTDADNRVNAWLTYRAISYFDFPQNFGKLASLDGIQNRAILARFENKTLLYNSLLTMDTSNPQSVYVGNPLMFKNPPIDFAETDLGYVGSQHKMLLKIPQGQITADAKRGQIFLISNTNAVDLSGFGSGMNRFFTDHLAFEILRYFPDADVDNNFTKIGLHGVYDSKYDRVILTKLDYIPLNENIVYDPITKEYYLEEVIELPDAVPTTSTTSTTTTEYIQPCSGDFYFGSGGFYPYTWKINVGPEIGWVKLDYVVTHQFAKFIVNFDGVDVVDTGYRGIPYDPPVYPYSNADLNVSLATYGDPPENVIGGGTGSVWFYKATDTSILFLNVYSPIGDSEWGISLNCPVPNEPTTTSTTSTTTTTTTVVPITTTTSTSTTVVPTTSTTTTTTTIIVSEGSVLFNTGNFPTQVYAYDPATNISSLLTVPGIVYNSDDIAHTANKLWLYSGVALIKEWNITLNPFVATFNRDIHGVYNNAGLCAKDDITLINVNGIAVYECNIAGSTSVNTFKFNLISGRIVAGDFVLTTGGKLIVLSYVGSDSFVTQYDYTTGVVEVDIPLTIDTPFGLYEYGGGIYIASYTILYNIGIATPYTVTPLFSSPYSINGASQLPSFSTVDFIPTATTTTTTTADPGIIITPDCLNVSSEQGTELSGTFKPNLAFYRNYEADNTLPLDDYVGRIKPIQTPIEFVETATDYVILRNVPNIPEVYTNPGNFGLYNISVLTYPDNNLSHVTSAENLGTYLGNSHCVKFYVTPQSTGTIGDKYGIYNIFPTGVWRNLNIIVGLGSGSWNSQFVVGAAGTWKKTDGTYAMLVTGYNPAGTPTKVKQHLFYASSLIGPWVDQNTTAESIFTSTYLPAGYIGCNTVIGLVDLGGGLHAGATSLIDTSQLTLYPSIALWNDSLTRRGGFNIIHDYTFDIGFTPYVSLVYYKDKYYYSLHDGAFNSGKRQVLVSDCLEGTYSLHSTILDFADPQMNVSGGLMYFGSFASGRLFTLANKLYFASSGESMYNKFAGELSNHCIYIWLYDDATNTWSCIVSPAITAPHSSAFFGYTWGTDHTGYMDGIYIEDNKLWFTYALITTADAYQLTNAYFDLSVLLT